MMMKAIRRLGLACALAALWTLPVHAEGFLRTHGTRIVDEDGRTVILRGMGLGGWMLQEGYMLQLGDLGQQHVIRRRIAALIGEERTRAFYAAWLDNYITKADVDAMADWGYNSIRLPMHYDLLTLPVEAEPVAGRDTWLEPGFRRIDELVAWSKANGLYLILDLHAAPGGQGTDLPIADRDPAKPSLWDSAENQRKTVALWREIARRYADEPTIGGYDILNEPNWDFGAAGGGHGCEETGNAPLRALMMRITGAIRAEDTRHLIVVEGNCWGNNYRGVLPPWDGNMVLSFHKYWNRNTPESIADIVALRDRYGVPVWLGESGENSNAWFADAIELVEDQGIGWAFWPLKKIGFNNPLEVRPDPGWTRLVEYWTKGGPAPSPDEAYATLMRLATYDVRFENTVRHDDVADAMLRQPHSDRPRAFRAHRLGAEGAAIPAVDYDMGRPGVAYRDTDDANYHVSTGGERTEWNTGRTYRNDGVDIAREADGTPFVTAFVDGEWMRYTVASDRPGARAVTLRVAGARGGTLSVAVNGGAPRVVRLGAAEGWRTIPVGRFDFAPGNNRLVVTAVRCDCRLAAIGIEARDR